jgi:hypothetical protein
MHYIDYSTVRINHNYKQALLAQETEVDLMARLSKGSSPTLKSLAKDKLGDGLITMGKLLKSRNIAKQSSEPCQ